MSARKVGAAEPVEPVGPVEPVHWGAPLVRNRHFVYTEVAATPVLVRDSDAAVVALTPTWAAIWGSLDGRPVAESLQIDPSTLPAVDARNLIEVLRRLKAQEVVCDVGPTATVGHLDDPSRSAPLGGAVRIALRAAMPEHRTARILCVDQGSPHHVEAVLTDTGGGAEVKVRRRWRWRPVTGVEVVDPRAGTTSLSALERFRVIVEALVDRSVLLRPGVVDLLADLAERANAPESPGH